jgi:DNA modification methylase
MNEVYAEVIRILEGDCRELLPTLEPGSVQCCVTSPPYWGLRDYGIDSQLGLEATPEEYVAAMVAIFREVWRVLRDDGTLWLNLGDSYVSSGTQSANSGLAKLADKWAPRVNPRNPNRDDRGEVTRGTKAISPWLRPKDLCGIPWRVAFALQADGWYLRSDIIWHKPNPMPESVTDRPTKAHEYIFLLSKRERYFYDAEAIKERANYPEGRWGGHNPRPGIDINGGGQASRDGFDSKNPAIRNKRSVWTIATQPYSEAHFATFPEELPKLCILAGTKPGDTVLDPFAGSGTTLRVALELGRKAIGIELNPQYLDLIRSRTDVTPGFVFRQLDLALNGNG